MTFEQAIKRIQDKESLINQLKIEVAETKKTLGQLAPFKVGQKVNVHCSGGSAQKKTIIPCFIWRVNYRSYRKDMVEYDFAKIKKDGTMSGQSAGIYSYDKIEHHE